MLLRNTDKDHLHEIFPLPSQNIPTRGCQDGVIIKFQTFYLKIYDASREDKYIVQGYRYNQQLPVFETEVPSNQMKEFAMRFTQENYLIDFQEPCDDPNCFLFAHNMMTKCE